MMPAVIKFLGAISLLFASLSVHAADTATAETPEAAALQIVELADYIAVDYYDAISNGQVISVLEYTEMIEFSQQIKKLAAGLSDVLDPATLSNIDRLTFLISNNAVPLAVEETARSISLAVNSQFSLIVPPTKEPSPADGAKLYQSYCASCHGATGKGDGAAAGTLQPRPIDFTNYDRAKLRTIDGLYNTIANGVAGTSMQGYSEQLDEDQMWSLAFYTSQMYASDTQLQSGKEIWDKSADKPTFTQIRVLSKTPKEEENAGVSADLIAYLRHNPDILWEDQIDPWMVTHQMLHQSMAEIDNGNFDRAYQFALTAYLEGFELLEPVIDTYNSRLRQDIEQLMIDYRQNIKKNDAFFAKRDFKKLEPLLEQAKVEVNAGDVNFFAILLSSLIILFREGLEIILILSLMLVLAKRMQQTNAKPYIHSGWIAAVFVGIGLWLLSHHFISISGAQRETTEGILSVLAAGILFYVGFWIHRQSTAKDWQESLSGEMEKHFAKRSMLGLAFISFIAVFREVFEIALFYETLWLQTEGKHIKPILLGVLIAMGLLLAFAFALKKLSMRLPLKKFFLFSGILIIVLSVIFLGSGLQSLAEAGDFPYLSLGFGSMELLGIYPNLWALLLQVLVVIAGIYFWYKQGKDLD